MVIIPNISHYLDLSEPADSDLMESEPKSREEKAEALRKAFGRQIKEAREEHGYSQAQLSRMCDGMHPQHLSQIERGVKMTHPTTLLRFSEILGIDFTISAHHLLAAEQGPNGPDTPGLEFKPG